MSRGIFLIGQGNQLLEMREQPYDSEALLQELLAKYPALLAGDQVDRNTPRRWLLVKRELGLPCEDGGADRWSVDHLLLDQDAVPTVVEVKRSSDSRIRREVVGQMLEYAANAVLYWPVETLRAQFEAGCQVEGINPDQQLAEFLGPDADASAFWQQVKTNLQAGKIRLIFVGDEIPSELRRIVEFLNEQMDPAEVLAVEIKQFVGENLRTLVPTVIGQTEEAQQRKSTGSTPSRQWNEQTFFDELSRLRPAPEVEVARKLFAWANSKAMAKTTELSWGSGPKEGSFSCSVRFNGGSSKLFMIYTFGSIETYFARLGSKPPFDHAPKLQELLERANSLLDTPISPENLGVRRLIKLGTLTDDRVLARFLEVIEWILSEIKARP